MVVESELFSTFNILPILYEKLYQLRTYLKRSLNILTISIFKYN